MTLIKYFGVLFWAATAIVCGLFLFTNGFFLCKNTIIQLNNCSLAVTQSFNFENPLIASTTCLKPPARIIVLIIDALKYEFTLNFSHEEAAGTYHRNKLPIFSEILQKYPKNSKLFKFVADPPTTTMQRLKALTTGTLPTFIDINKNFAADAIEEDNFIVQNEANGNVVIGDSTWSDLYPGKFLRDHTVYSFDVSDLDTVDKSVEKHVFKEIKNNDWKLMIAHTLGIDHCGHTYGMNHPQMLRKLNETNILVQNLINEINKDEENTVLFIMGDHGMTKSGDHGGESSDETDAALFVYSTLPLVSPRTSLNVALTSTVNQVDIVPTVSVILGIPIPFSNVGKVIIEALPTEEATMSKKSFNFILHSLWRNVVQVQNYLITYSIENSFSAQDQLEKINGIYSELLQRVPLVKFEKDLKDFINIANEYFFTVRKVCLKEWVQFDNNLMARGMLVMFFSLFSLFIIITGLIRERIHSVLHSSFLMHLFVIVMMSLVINVILYYVQIVSHFQNSLLFTCGLSLIVCFAILSIKNWDCISDSWYEQSRRKEIVDFLSRLVFLVSAFGVFSNSYILEENKIMLFFVITLFCLFFYSIHSKSLTDSIEKKGKEQSKKTSFKSMSYLLVLIVCILIRMSKFYWRYRPEDISRMKQNELNNTQYIIGKMGSMTSQQEEIYFAVTAIVLSVIYYIMFKLWLQKCGNLSGHSPGVILNKYLTRIVLVVTSCYWILRLKVCDKLKLKNLNSFPILIYIVVSSALCVIFCWPLSVFLVSRENEVKIRTEEATVPKLYEKFKNTLYVKKNEEKKETPIVYGLGTVYSACFISVGMFLCLLYILLLGFLIAPSVIIMNMVCVILLYVSAMDRIHYAKSLEELIRVPNMVILCWFLIAEYFFFATGHQATFSSIHWDSGFIGIDGSLSSVMFLRAVLITINTFGSYIILGVMLPLLVIAPLTMRFVFPNFTRASKTSLIDVKRGELLLFHNSALFHAEMFSVCGKYILFHAFKVFVCMLAVTLHSRHLMVWAIFAPKFIFTGISFLVTLGSILTSQLLLLRIENSIEQFYSKIS
ncbi:GPI ethanolamine phosphate transferase 3-like [Copidosoma floridanum]|uniref:GPI ethanolamine phosphate transferase 3-like n=1 Tax=Copidosoma floridanum TaxID=29053 RepID=UPI0006C96366|nr:GPI ethanolamine phosphate transferase 3-like [Copidosoma floridanum]